MTDPITIARAQAAIENGLIDALRSQQQADMDGTTVIVSRQACDEAAEFLPALYDEVKRLRAALTIYAQSGNWRLGGCCDPNSPNFTGEAIARAALKGDSDE